MKKEEFIALGISEELAAKAEQASENELKAYVPAAEHEAAKQAKDQLEKDIKDRDKQLETLKKSSGKDADLAKQIEALQEENKAAKDKYAAEMKELQLSAAVKIAVAGEAHDVDIVAGLVDKSKLVLTDDGKVAGLDDQIKVLKESKAFLFKSDGGADTSTTTGTSASKGSKGGYQPKAGATNEGSIAKAIAESLNKSGATADNPYAQAWG